MSLLETGKTLIDATINTVTNPTGTASLVSGFATLKRAKDAGVTEDQMKAIFPDLRDKTDAEISGFISIGEDLVNGDVHIQSMAFGEKQQTEMKEKFSN